MPGRVIIIGTRGSQLAMAQARRVQQGLSGPSEIRIIKTSGDRFQDKPLHEQNGIGFFTKEIESELRSGNIDLAVHSLKDLPTVLAPGLALGAVLERDDASDILLANQGACQSDLPIPLKSQCSVGASSLRRQALLRSFRDDLAPTPIRGNVPTRIGKAQAGDFDAIVLARAGLSRLALNIGELQAFDLNPLLWICAPGQGTIAVETREGDAEVQERLSGLEHAATRACVQAERSLLVTYGGGCHAPFGAYAVSEEDRFRLTVAAPDPDGAFRVESFMAADLEQTRLQAADWIQSGRPERTFDRGETWLARPARPWC